MKVSVILKSKGQFPMAGKLIYAGSRKATAAIILLFGLTDPEAPRRCLGGLAEEHQSLWVDCTVRIHVLQVDAETEDSGR